MNWKDISLQDLDLIQSIKRKNELDFITEVITIVTGQSRASIQRWKMRKLMRWNRKLSFLKSMPKPSNSRWFFYKGILYVRRNYDDISSGEFIDADAILNGKDLEALKMAKLLRIFYRPFNKKYKGKIDDSFYQMDVSKAYSHCVFFYIGAKKSYLKGIKRFLAVEMNKKATEENYQKVLVLQQAFNNLQKMMPSNGTHL